MVLTKILHRVFQNSHTTRDWFFGKSSYMGKTPCVWAIYWGSFLWGKIEFVLEKSLYWKISLCVRSELCCVESLKFFKDHLCVCELCTVKFYKKSLQDSLSNTLGKSTPHHKTQLTCKGALEIHIPHTGESCEMPNFPMQGPHIEYLQIYHNLYRCSKKWNVAMCGYRIVVCRDF